MEANRFRFRAWDGESMMDGSTSELYVEFYTGKTHDVTTCGYDLIISERPNLILMQSTGLTDANGVEIFDGDVVRPLTVSSWADQLLLVEWRGMAFGFRGLKRRANHLVDYSWDTITNDKIKTVQMEVIGNIHQNPELLETA